MCIFCIVYKMIHLLFPLSFNTRCHRKSVLSFVAALSKILLWVQQLGQGVRGGKHLNGAHAESIVSITYPTSSQQHLLCVFARLRI